MRELLATALELAGEGLDVLVDNLVSSHIAALGKSLAADVAVVRPLARVAAFVSLCPVRACSVCWLLGRAYLEVAKLGESLSAGRLLADLCRWSVLAGFKSWECGGPTKGLKPVCARRWISKWVFW